MAMVAYEGGEIAAESLWKTAGKRFGRAAVEALAQKIYQEIYDNATVENAHKAAKWLAPGKKNAAKRAAAVQTLTLRKGGRGMSGAARNALSNIRSAPVALNVPVRRTQPRFRSAAGIYTITNREFIGDIVSTGLEYEVSSYSIQPALVRSFPWLSTIAPTHEKYRFKSLRYHYVPLAATSERGRVIMAIDYDALDDVPTNKIELFQFSNSVEGSFWAPLSLTSNKPQNGQLFTRTGAIGTADLKTYDYGRLHVAVSNGAAPGARVGELFVEYEVELITPQPSICPSGYFRSLLSTLDATHLFGAGTGETYEINSLPVRVQHTDTSDDRVYFDAPGIYVLHVKFYGTGITSIIIDASQMTGVGGVVTELDDDLVAAGVQKSVMYKVTVSSTTANDSHDQYLKFTVGAATTITSASVLVTMFSNNTTSVATNGTVSYS